MKPSLRSRISKLEEINPPENLLPTPRLVSVYVDAPAPCLNGGPIKWGTIEGVDGIIERLADESDEAFIAGLEQHLPDVMPSNGYSVTIYAETRRPA